MEYGGVSSDYSNSWLVGQYVCPSVTTIGLLFIGTVGVIQTRDCQDYCPGRSIAIVIIVCGVITGIASIVFVARRIFQDYQERENVNRALIADVNYT